MTTLSFRRSAVATKLGRGQLGEVPLSGLLLAALTPLVVFIGVIPVAYGATGLEAVPLAFVIGGVVLAVFLVAYLTMARHVAEPGAFFSYISLGLGRLAGVTSAVLAAWAYCQLHTGLYGLFGVSAAGLSGGVFGWPWWAWALASCAVVAVLGALRIDVGAWVLAPLVGLEMATIVALSIKGLAHPAAGHLTFTAFNPRLLLAGGATAAFGIVILAFVGVEQAATYATKVKDGRTTMLRASLGVLALGGIVYVLGSWAPQVFYGDNLASASADPNVMFTMGGNGRLAQFAHIQLLLSIGAALLAFHNATVQYLYGLGKQRVLPAALGRTNRFDAPWVASLTQSAIAAATIAVVAVVGWDPLTQMFYGLGNAGGLGVLVLLAVTSVAVWRFFRRSPQGQTRWSGTVAPILAAAALGAMAYLVVANYATLLNVAPGSVAAWAWPASLLIPLVGGLARAVYLKVNSFEVYAAMVHHRATPPTDDDTRELSEVGR